jgi:hypothetical protein
MESLDWVDRTYIQMHKSDDPSGLRAMYFPNLRMYKSGHTPKDPNNHKNIIDGVLTFLTRFSKRAGISLAIYLLSFLPVVGRLVLPVASFYTFRKAVSTPPAVAIFAVGLFLPKRYLVVFLQTYFTSRTLMRELVSDISITLKVLESNAHSLCLTLIAFSSHQNKRNGGLKTEKEFYLVLQSLSLCSSRYH